MALIGDMNTLQVIRQADFGVYLDGGPDGDILLPRREMPKDEPCEDEDWLNVFVYLDSEDRIIATSRTPKIKVGEFASLKVIDINRIGLFLDWGLSKDLLLPHSEEKRPLQEGDYCVVHAYIDERTKRITATAHLDRFLDKTPANYSVGQEVDLLIVEPTDLGFKAIINSEHWGLIHKNEAFKFLRGGMQERGFIREIRDDGLINLSLQPQGQELRDTLSEAILTQLRENNGHLPLSDKSPAPAIADAFGVSKGNFKKAIGGLYRQGVIRIHPHSIELV
ncbi:S1 RNA-binding domain-containing protein [Denitrificimonas caeni]|uniref:S1-like domain-containing RNA-binding protein n=1 Tax=Denitrificimonas caeni TaxID=521720 RepID=A0AAF0AJU6_9GAMM|nr:S1-like domain-containing RNA-binding protein [Denitrificimonas caeni]NLJ13509.1 GntR family transcriptional regulator [Gammaproteobacteria bacterium]WBE24746.1 S1-like domain-containing RNA-binding protein [Denitrificimonas caeni]